VTDNATEFLVALKEITTPAMSSEE